MNESNLKCTDQELLGINKKSYIVAALLWHFLGLFGVDQFYLGNFSKGIIKLICTITIILIPVSLILTIIQLTTLLQDINKINGVEQSNQLFSSNEDIAAQAIYNKLDKPQQTTFYSYYVSNRKSYKTLVLLWMFLGYFGVDQFYLGKTKLGILKLLCSMTFFFFWITAIVNIINLVTLLQDLNRTNAKIANTLKTTVSQAS